MSLDAYVLFDRGLQSVAEWQRAIDSLGFDLTLASDEVLEGRKGHLPAWLDGREAGFECSTTVPVAEILETFSEIDFGPRKANAMAFYIGASFTGCVAVWIAIAAWASATDGIAFDPQDGLVMDAEAAIRYAKETAIVAPELERQLMALEQDDLARSRRRNDP